MSPFFELIPLNAVACDLHKSRSATISVYSLADVQFRDRTTVQAAKLLDSQHGISGFNPRALSVGFGAANVLGQGFFERFGFLLLVINV
jgi:hypothetical protein